MRTDLIVSKSIVIDASQDKVWEGLTTPEIIKDYLFGTDTVTDWKVGSEIIFQGEYEGTKYRDHGHILENEPKTKIKYSYWSGFSGVEDKPENYSEITYDLKPVSEGKTEFTWTQKNFASEEAYKHSESGMDEFLKKMKSVIESRV